MSQLLRPCLVARLAAGCVLALCLEGSALATLSLYSGPFADDGPGPGVVPDNDLLGWTDARNVAGLGPSIADATLSVQIDGTVVGDLTGYLRLGNTLDSPSVDLGSYLVAGNNDFSVPLSAFLGLNPNDTWTLFLADISPGGENRVRSWSLDIVSAVIPEPVGPALRIFAVVFGGVWVLGRAKQGCSRGRT